MSQNPKYRDNLIVRLTFEFALDIVKYTEELERLKKFNLSKQLFRAATSIGANVMEAQNAESKADFIHKMKIALKEVDETEYWLMLCEQSENYPGCADLLNKLSPIGKVLNKIVGSSKSKRIIN